MFLVLITLRNDCVIHFSTINVLSSQLQHLVLIRADSRIAAAAARPRSCSRCRRCDTNLSRPSPKALSNYAPAHSCPNSPEHSPTRKLMHLYKYKTLQRAICGCYLESFTMIHAKTLLLSFQLLEHMNTEVSHIF